MNIYIYILYKTYFLLCVAKHVELIPTISRKTSVDFCSGWQFKPTTQEQHGREGEHTDVVMVTWIFVGPTRWAPY